MNKGKIVALLLTISLIGIGVGTIMYKQANASSDVKVLEYKTEVGNKENNTSLKNIIESNESYQIQKIENVNGVTWVSDNEILNLTETEEFNKFSLTPYYTCSIYNIETKKVKEYDDVCIEGGGVYGVSPDGKYLLYKEGKDTSKYKDMTEEQFFSSSEAKNKIKILDLSTGEVSDFEEIEFTSIFDYKWIDNDKIVCTEPNNPKWSIKNISGQVLNEGNIDGLIKIFQIDNLTEDKDKIKGDIYYKKAINDGSGRFIEYSICKMNIDTEENTEIKRAPLASQFTMAGDTIVQSIAGKEINYLDKEGKLLKKITNEDANSFMYRSVASNDGSRGVFIYSDDYQNKPSTGINIIDIKTGFMKEIATISSLSNTELQNDYIFEYYPSGKIGERQQVKQFGPILKMGNGIEEDQLSWSKDGKSLIFTYQYNSKQDDKNYIDTYIVKFE